MEMSIDEAIKQLETYSIPCGKYKKAYDCAISTMRKYLYVQEIYKSWKTGDYKGSTECMEEIGEVLKDGKID